jgi:hypothetical protein
MKGNDLPKHTTKTYGEVEELFHTFLIYALDGDVINFTHWTRGWVGLTAGLDDSEKI